MLCFPVGAHRVRKVGREALESSSAVLQTAAKPSQLPARDQGLGALATRPRKKARRRVDAGPWWLFQRVRPSVIGAFYRWWAHNRAVRSPLGQTASRRYSPRAVKI